MASQPSVTGVRRGHRVHFGMHSSSSMMPCELFPSVCLYTAYWDQEFAAQSSVLLWTHQRVPIGPFEILCYHAIKGKLSGLKEYMEELINLMWFLWWLHSNKREKRKNKNTHILVYRWLTRSKPHSAQFAEENTVENVQVRSSETVFLCFVVPLKTLTPAW